MRMIILFGAIFSISLRRGLAHRANLFFEALMSVTGIAAGLATLGIVYTRTDTLGGWSLGEAVVVFGLWELGTIPTPWSVLAWLLMVTVGIGITWASRVLMASLAFWGPSLQAAVLYKALWQFGRYPVSIYQQPIRFALTYILPVAFITTVPAQALTRGASPLLLMVGLAVGLGAILIAQLVWKAGLRRYTSATS